MKAKKRAHYAANRGRLQAERRAARVSRPTRFAEKARRSYVKNITSAMLRSARVRAETYGVPFALDASDIKIPETCPVLGLKLQIGTRRKHDHSPSLDRLVPSLGYVPGNVWVISYRANRIKTDATLEELERVVVALRERLRRGAA